MATKPKTPIYVSGPGAVRGSAPIVTKPTPQVKPKTPPKTNTDKKTGGIQFYPGTFTPMKYVPTNPVVEEEPPTDGAPQVDAGLEYQKAMDEKARQDAFQVMRATFESYGLGSLADTLTRMFKMGLSPNEALVKMKYDKSIDPVTNKPWNASYTLRFAGNEKRKAKGLNALSEAEYLASEDSYAETLRSYGLGNMLSVDRTVNEAKFSEYIGNDMSPVEFKDRVSTASDRVINADKGIKDTFKTFYPNLTDNDLIAYFLNPTETIGKLKEKATAAEIGGAFIGQGLTTSRMSAESFAAYGIDRATALKGAEDIAGVLPEATKLKNIYGETGIEYNQQTAEEEFLKSSDAAKRKRNILASKERASFEGSAGNAPGAYSTSYLKKSSARGLI